MFANKDRVDSELEDESSALLPSTNELAELPDEDKDLIFEESKSNCKILFIFFFFFFEI